jgi:hypothetical protein
MWWSMLLLTMSVTVIIVLHSTEIVHIPHELWFRHPSVTRKSPSCQIYTFFGVWPRDHYMMIQWFHLACNVPIEVSLPVWASHPPRSPLLCLMGSSHRSFTHTIPRFSHHNFTEHPSGLPLQLPRIASWYTKTSLYHILCQAIPI